MYQCSATELSLPLWQVSSLCLYALKSFIALGLMRGPREKGVNPHGATLDQFTGSLVVQLLLLAGTGLYHLGKLLHSDVPKSLHIVAAG